MKKRHGLGVGEAKQHGNNEFARISCHISIISKASGMCSLLSLQAKNQQYVFLKLKCASIYISTISSFSLLFDFTSDSRVGFWRNHDIWPAFFHFQKGRQRKSVSWVENTHNKSNNKTLRKFKSVSNGGGVARIDTSASSSRLEWNGNHMMKTRESLDQIHVRKEAMLAWQYEVTRRTSNTMRVEH